MKTTAEMIAVMQAYADGEKIEFYDKEHIVSASGIWEECSCPCWDWVTFDYRIKPKCKIIEEGAENYITQIEEMCRHSAQIINPSLDYTEFKMIWTESDVWNAFIAGARMQRDIDLHKAKNIIQEWLEDEGFCYDENIFILLQKSIMEE